MIKGTLIPIGGNEFKKFQSGDRLNFDFTNECILPQVVIESGGKNSKILIITTASGIPDEVSLNYIEAFDILGCKDVTSLHIDSKEMANHASSIELLEKCDCVLFSGGNQSKITKYICNTKFHEVLKNRYQNEDFVIAGTSAGAMCMAEEMISGGSSKESFIKGAIKMKKGLNLMPELIIDTHFIQRGRFGRLSEAVARFPKCIGVGLAEDTGLIIKNANRVEVIGSGMVIIFDPSQLIHNNISILKDNTPLTMTNLITHVLSAGDNFDIEHRTIKVLADVDSLLMKTE